MDRLLAALLLGLASAAAAADARPIGELQVPDARIADSERFGHFVDLSRPQGGAVVAGAWHNAPAASPLSAQPGLTRATAVPPPQPLFIPRGQLPPLPDLSDEKPKGESIGLATVAAVGVGLGLVLWGLGGPRRREGDAEPERPRPARRGSAPREELAPIEPWSEPARAPFGPVAERVSPAAEPQVGAADPFEPLPSISWYAITAAEQRAIDQWDRSPEKRLGLASLTEWLDRHDGRLAGVDVPLLKLKLTREA
ncbi:MAG: hypothetical protein HY553_04045 [Elusimicrobia bacterium]|nr:hypothetical protein [Elusimicrobiota bacterium]